jgi:hypothetical protein
LKYKLMWAQTSSIMEDLEVRATRVEEERNLAMTQLQAAHQMLQELSDRELAALQKAADESDRQKHLSAVIRVLTERLRSNGLSLSVQLPQEATPTRTIVTSPSRGSNGSIILPMTPRTGTGITSPTPSPGGSMAPRVTIAPMTPSAAVVSSRPLPQPSPPSNSNGHGGGGGSSSVGATTATSSAHTVVHHAGVHHIGGGGGGHDGVSPTFARGHLRSARSMSALPKDPRERVAVLRRWQIDRRRERAQVREHVLAKEENDPLHYRKKVRGVTPIPGVNDPATLAHIQHQQQQPQQPVNNTQVVTMIGPNGVPVVQQMLPLQARAVIVAPVATTPIPSSPLPPPAPPTSGRPITPVTTTGPVIGSPLPSPAIPRTPAASPQSPIPPSSTTAAAGAVPSTGHARTTSVASSAGAHVRGPSFIQQPVVVDERLTEKRGYAPTQPATPTFTNNSNNSNASLQTFSSGPRIVIPSTPPTASNVSTPTSNGGGGSGAHSRNNSSATATATGAAANNNNAQLMTSAAERANRGALRQQ